MHVAEQHRELTNAELAMRLALLIVISAGTALLLGTAGLDARQQVATGVFLAIILGTLFFWTFRLSIAFLGVAVLIASRSLSIPAFVESASLPVILFLAGMMVIAGALRDLGFFTWVVQSILSLPRMTGRKFMVTLALASALLACAVDEVTSIILITILVFQVCGRLKLDPVPYVIMCVLCTNVGSAGTMLGNPVSIYIGAKAGLTFQDFIVWAFPIMLVTLGITIMLTVLWFRKELREFDEKLQERLERNLSLAPKVTVPYKRSLLFLTVTVLFIASHHFLEELFHLERNSILLVAPLVCAGVIMIVRRDRARHYVENDVDWWELLFFMLLFAIAGTLEYTGVTAFMAEHFQRGFGTDLAFLVPVVMVITALGSAFVDNVIFVAAFSPVIVELGTVVQPMPLWWALLFGACIGGNITMIGSVANIVALGMLEKQYRTHMSFWRWLKVGVVVALIAGVVAWALIMLAAPFMPDALPAGL